VIEPAGGVPDDLPLTPFYAAADATAATISLVQ
jgi:hypothetical protein